MNACPYCLQPLDVRYNSDEEATGNVRLAIYGLEFRETEMHHRTMEFFCYHCLTEYPLDYDEIEELLRFGIPPIVGGI
jgi:uncharacterized protein YbaR (Trm112 family)